MLTLICLSPWWIDTEPIKISLSFNRQLAPALLDGQTVAIVPAVLADPDKIAPGRLVLASVENPDRPGLYEGAGLFKLNADRDLCTNRLTVARGKYLHRSLPDGAYRCSKPPA